MDIFDVLTLIGGLSLFLFGMNIMGQSLERRAGGKLRSLLGKLTTNKAVGLLTGLGITAVIQSSSATTVMVVGFVNSGLMTLKQAINVIMGANIGTTVTAWILSLAGIDSGNLFIKLLKPSSFTPVLALAGIIFYMFCKNDKKKDTGMILLGFATLMFGMETMSGAVSGLRDVPAFQSLFVMFQNPILGVLAGAVLAAIIQSSSASVGILQALASTGQVSYGAAIPIIMGQNIGTCGTASAEDDITPQEVNAIGLEFAQREFPGYEVVVATHMDTNHLHNHLVVNSVSCENGRKLHQNTDDLQRHRQANDGICLAHGLSVLAPPEKHGKKKRMKPGEYQAGLRADSWKLDLIHAINEALEYAVDRESFIENMELEGYEVIWTDTRKHITFVCPNGRRCRDSSLHDETFLKENLEALFAYRQATGFRPGSAEPDVGWMGELAVNLLRLGKSLEQDADLPLLPTPLVWTDSKQRRREALKKLAMGQKLSTDRHYTQSM